MNKKVEVLQEGRNDCGAACLLSIIKYYGGYIDIETIRDLINTNKNGTNAYDLIEGSKKIGFDACGKKVSFNELLNETNSLPLIAHVKQHNMYHFIVVYKIDFKKEKILIMDPNVGLTTIGFKNFEEKFLKTILIFSVVKDLPKVKKENKLLKLVFETILKKKKEITILSILSLLTFIFTIIDTFYYKILFDDKINNNTYYKYLIFFIIILIIKNLIMYLRNKKIIKIDHSLDNSINEYSLNKIFSLPYNYYKNKSTGEVVSRINDLETLKNLLSNLILNTFVNIFLISISFTIMFIVNKELVIISLIIIFTYFIIVKIFNNKYKTHIRNINEERGYYNELLTESLDNIESIKNLNIIEKRLKILNEHYKNILDLNKKISNINNKENALKNITYELGLIIIITIGMILVKENILNLGDVLLLYMMINFFISTIKELLDKHLEITFTLKKIERVNSLLINEEKIRKTNELLENNNIIVKNLNFNYGKDIKVLESKNLVIKKYDKIIITGKSGSGKSTLIKIILKYLTNYEGKILIGNRDLQSIDKGIINNSFNYIGQNERLFTDSFKNNITLNRDITDYEYEKILNICELINIRNKRKLKDDFLIEESGFNLSGGERQRIILARALLKKANFIIIDEALSEVNISVEEKIIKKLFEYYKDKTIIYITHKKEIKRLFPHVYNLERSIYE